MMLKNNQVLRKAGMSLGAALSVLAGVALFSYLTYIPTLAVAVTATTGTTGQEDSPVVSAVVKPVLILEVSTTDNSDVVSVAASSEEVVTGQFQAKVTSNHGYTLGLSAAKDYTPDLKNRTNEKIPAVADDAIVEAGKSAWGIRACVDGNASYGCGENDNVLGGNPFRAIGETDQSKEFYRSTSSAEDTVTSFQVGIGVDAGLSSGVYLTNVVVTATQI